MRLYTKQSDRKFSKKRSKVKFTEISGVNWPLWEWYISKNLIFKEKENERKRLVILVELKTRLTFVYARLISSALQLKSSSIWWFCYHINGIYYVIHVSTKWIACTCIETAIDAAVYVYAARIFVMHTSYK